MNESKHTPTLWDYLAALVWSLVLLAGFLPEAIFGMLREWGRVPIHLAFTNTPWFITFSCTGFLGWFTYQRCRDCEERDDIAFGKAVQMGILGMAAFLPIQIEQIPAYLHIPIPFYRYLIFTIIAVKTASWVYLVQLVMRYHLFSGLDVFRKTPLLFPSAMYHQSQISDQGGDKAEGCQGDRACLCPDCESPPSIPKDEERQSDGSGGSTSESATDVSS